MQGIAVAVQQDNTSAVRGASPPSDNVLYLTIHILGRDVPEMLQLTLLTEKLAVVLAMNTHEGALLPCLGHAPLTCPFMLKPKREHESKSKSSSKVLSPNSR